MNLQHAIPLTQALSPWLAIFVSVIAAIFSIKGFLLSKRVQRDMQADEILIAGELHNPKLSHPDHENCVIQTIFFNKSKRKAYISQVEVFDRNNNQIEISWAATIDNYGNPQDKSNLIGIIDSSYLCIRRNDGLAFNDVTVRIKHSFSETPLVMKFDALTGWQEFFAK